MSNFKNLNLDRDKISLCIDTIDCKSSMINDSSTKIEYQIIKDKKSCKLIIHKKSDGTTTLQIQGKPAWIDIGNEICEEIKSNCTINEINASVKITKEDFQKILEKVKEKYPENLTEIAVNGGTSYILQKPKEGKFTFTYYTKSNKLLLQGKTLGFFSYIIYLLTEFNYDALSHVLEATQDIHLEESNTLLDEFLPTIGNKLPDVVKKIMTPSLQLIRVNATFPDYTIIIFPSLKTLEYVIIIALKEKGIPYNKECGFDMFEKYSPNNSYYLPTQGRQPLKGTLEAKIGNCYTFFHKHRHGLFHSGEDLADIRIIEDKQQALDLLMECIELMEDIGDNF